MARTQFGLHHGWRHYFGKSRKRPFTIHDFFTKPKFYVFFLIAVMLHTFWDWDIPNTGLNVSIMQEILDVIVGWFLIYIMIDAGLREVKTLQGQRIIVPKARKAKKRKPEKRNQKKRS